MSASGQMIDLLKSLPKARILCVGDAMLDRFIYGEVERISPEAPIPVLRVDREVSMPGGAGNVARNIAALGGQTLLLASIGEDAAGADLKQLLGGVDGLEHHLVIESERHTGVKSRFLAGAQQMLRTDSETVGAVDQQTQTQILEKAEAWLPRCGAMILSDYGKGVLADGVAKRLIEAAKRAEVPVIVDPKGRDYSIYEGATLITPNLKELAEATGLPTDGDSQVGAAGKRLVRAHGLGGVLVTRSADGMSLLSDDEEPIHLPTEAREVFDVSGAGDTVVACLALGLAAGADPRTAAALANVAAGIVVGKAGTAVAYAEELVTALHHQDMSDSEAKLCSAAAAVAQIADWRKNGAKIGFTNGCFDLLHPGHISLMKQAKAACDRLVVGVNSDLSVTRLKGPSRPIQSEAARATVLAALEQVDSVVLFDEDTPKTLIEAIRPDVLIKGADYDLKDVVGADYVRSYGGRVLLARLEEGHSTSSTIGRLNKD